MSYAGASGAFTGRRIAAVSAVQRASDSRCAWREVARAAMASSRDRLAEPCSTSAWARARDSWSCCSLSDRCSSAALLKASRRSSDSVRIRASSASSWVTFVRRVFTSSSSSAMRPRRASCSVESSARARTAATRSARSSWSCFLSSWASTSSLRGLKTPRLASASKCRLGLFIRDSAGFHSRAQHRLHLAKRVVAGVAHLDHLEVHGIDQLALLLLADLRVAIDELDHLLSLRQGLVDRFDAREALR